MDVMAQRAHVIQYYGNLVKKFAHDATEIIILKGEDYAPERVAMTEVFFTAAELGVSAPQILWVHVCKHKSAIASFMQRGVLKSEDIRSRLMDVSNYMALIDSCYADPIEWLRQLLRMIDMSEFPHRTAEEISNLRKWVIDQAVTGK